MYKKLLFFILVPVLGISQVQIGADIDGKNSGDNSYRVDLSSDGSIIAIGAPHNDGNGYHSGIVTVYKNISGVWIQIGNDIYGEASGDGSGFSVSLSSDGSIVAIGAYFNKGNGFNSGHVHVYKNISGVWTQVGNDIDGATGGTSGFSVSLSSDGSIVAIGAPQRYTSSQSGYVGVYKNISGIWTQIGSDITGEAAGDESGSSVSLSSDGSILAIGAPSNNGNGNGSGHVRVYKNVSGVWTQIGSDIDGETTGDRSGHNVSSISLSADGSILAIGAPYNDGNGTNSGHVRIYENISGVWNKAGNDIDGEAVGDLSGSSVSLSADGSILAIGAPGNNGNGNGSGHIRVYDISGILSTNNFISESFDVFPNPVSDVLNIRMKNNLSLEKITIYNNSGQIVKTAQQNTVDVSNLSSGIYFVEVITNQGIATKKVVVK